MNHSFNIDIAAEYGIPCAVLLEHIWFWISKNTADGRHFHDGTYWTYSSVKAFSKLFPYMSKDQIRRALEKLVAEGLLITGNFNEEAYDRTLWYALTEKAKSILQNRQSPLANLPNPFGTDTEPIPDINTDIDNRYNQGVVERAREEPPDMNPWGVFIREYQNNIGLMPTSTVEREDLTMFYEEFGTEAIVEFIHFTARKHPDNPHVYFSSLYRKYLGKDIKTAEQAKAAIMDYDRQKGGRNGANRSGPGQGAGKYKQLFDGEKVV